MYGLNSIPMGGNRGIAYTPGKMHARIGFSGITDLQHLQPIIEHNIAEALRDSLMTTVKSIQEFAPYRTGRLKRSIHWGISGLNSGVVFTDSEYAYAQEEGAEIYPRRRTFLHWVNEGGEDVYAQHVSIPATYFFTRGVIAADPLIGEILGEAGTRLALEMGFYGV